MTHSDEGESMKDKKEFTRADVERLRLEIEEKAKETYQFDRQMFILELIAALNITGGDSISKASLEKMMLS